MLEADSISMAFGQRQILSGCYLSCKPGEIVGLLGRNGSGKSTLLKIIFGSVKADFSHLRIDSNIIKNGFLSADIGYLPQQSFIPSFYRVQDIVARINVNLLTEDISEYLAKIEKNRLRDVSGGELKFLECLWILSLPATYLLLDEPFSGVSPLQIGLLQEALKIAALHKGIILTDHLYRPLLEISSRIILLHNNAVYPIQDESDLIRYSYIPAYLQA